MGYGNEKAQVVFAGDVGSQQRIGFVSFRAATRERRMLHCAKASSWRGEIGEAEEVSTSLSRKVWPVMALATALSFSFSGLAHGEDLASAQLFENKCAGKIVCTSLSGVVIASD